MKFTNRRRPMPDRFWEKVEKTDGCWNWIGFRGRDGYGVINKSRRDVVDGERRSVQAHRYSYELLVGPIPDGLLIDHLCRNRRCVNPEHLEPVTHRENILRGETVCAANFKKTECINGHPFDEKNTRYSRERDGSMHRDCRRCDADRAARKRESRRAVRKAL